MPPGHHKHVRWGPHLERSNTASLSWLRHWSQFFPGDQHEIEYLTLASGHTAASSANDKLTVPFPSGGSSTYWSAIARGADAGEWPGATGRPHRMSSFTSIVLACAMDKVHKSEEHRSPKTSCVDDRSKSVVDGRWMDHRARHVWKCPVRREIPEGPCRLIELDTSWRGAYFSCLGSSSWECMAATSKAWEGAWILTADRIDHP